MNVQADLNLFPQPKLGRMLLSGNRTRIGDAVTKIKASGTTDDYARSLLVVRRKEACCQRRLLGLIKYTAVYSERERRSALTALGLLWGTMGRELAIALDYKASHFERLHAHQALSRRRDQRATRPLSDALLSGHALEDWQCVRTIGSSGDQNAAQVLLCYVGLMTMPSEALLRANSNGAHVDPASSIVNQAKPKIRLDVGIEVGSALQDLNARNVIPMLEQFLQSLQPDQRACAALVLGGLCESKDEKQAEALITLLTDPEALVRASAVRALGEMRVRSSLPPLQERLADLDADVRLAAEQAVQQVSKLIAPRKDKLSTAQNKRPAPVWRY